MTTNIGIEIENVSKDYRIGKSRVSIFENLTMTVPDNDFLAIMGPSGSGKSTILNLIGGIDTVDEGTVRVGDVVVSELGDRALTQWRSVNIGFIFQFYNLMPMLTAAENVELPLLLTPLSRRERHERVNTILEVVGLDDRHNHLPTELSGGQQQRVGIARAVASDPRIILCDEPTGDLDRASASEILEILRMLNHELGKTIVMVTHDESATRMAKRTLLLDKGNFVAQEAPQCA